MTKIKIIGNPGRQPVNKLIRWVRNSLQVLNLSPKEIYLIFFADSREIKTIYEKYIKGVEKFSSRERLMTAETKFREITSTAYLQAEMRKEGTPPVILIKRGARIREDDILDEIAHLKKDENGWNKILMEALILLYKDYKRSWSIPFKQEDVFRWLSAKIVDFFSSEILSQYKLPQVIKERERKLNIWLREHFPRHGRSNDEDFQITATAAFWTILPPSYLKREDEKKLESIIINSICQMNTELLYQRIKNIVKKLESPPRVANIYKVGSEIIELTQEFLSK